MIAEARRNEIINLIKKEKSMSCSRLSKIFNVTEETVRRDLAYLNKKGLITRTHGGGMINGESLTDPDSNCA